MRALEDANALAVAQEAEVEIVDHLGVEWEQSLQNLLRRFGADARADQPQALADAVDMRIYGQNRLAA